MFKPVIAGYARSPFTMARKGALIDVKPVNLLAEVIKNLVAKSKINKDAEFTFTVPGIYAYWCTPHKTMGMIGFVIVGDDLSNLDSIKKVKFGGKSKKIAKGLIAEIEG